MVFIQVGMESLLFYYAIQCESSIVFPNMLNSRLLLMNVFKVFISCVSAETFQRKRLYVYTSANLRICLDVHCMKNVRIQSFSGPYFPAFGLNTERYGVHLRIQSECMKMWTRKTPNTDTFTQW